MKIEKIVLILSDICNSECEICSMSCSPHNNNMMTEELMLKVIEQAKINNLTKYVCFDGGEPFLHYDLLKKGLEYSKASGFRNEVCTNGFWGGWTDNDMEEKIGSLPIDKFVLSTDSYHERFVSGANIGRAVSFIKMLKIDLFIKIGETKSSESACRYFNRMDGYKYLNNIIFYPFIRIGRAEKLPEENFYSVPKRERLLPSDASISVRYDGCVCSYRDCEIQTATLLGNINERNLADILSQYDKYIRNGEQ